MIKEKIQKNEFNPMLSEKKAQTSIELLLVLGGVMIVVLIVALIIKNAINSQTPVTQNAMNAAENQIGDI